jgi:chromosome segregation ATPase
MAVQPQPTLLPPHLFSTHKPVADTTTEHAESRELLPPSRYTTTRSPTEEPWNSLAKATSEILQLKDNNQRLRRQVEELKTVERRYKDDANARRLLSAAEAKIQTLENQLVDRLQEQRQVVADKEARLKEREDELLDKVRQQDERLEELREERVRSVTLLEGQLEKEREDHESVVRKLEHAMATNREQSERDIQELKQSNEEKLKEMEGSVKTLEEELMYMLILAINCVYI